MISLLVYSRVGNQKGTKVSQAQNDIYDYSLGKLEIGNNQFEQNMFDESYGWKENRIDCQCNIYS